MGCLKTVAYSFTLLLFSISWLSWIVMLGGVAGMQAKCGGYLGHTVNITIGGQDFTGIDEGCDTTNTTAFIWWSTWFEFFLLILLSVAECGRVQGLFLTKQLFLAMVSVCMMLAADRANVVISNFDGALRTSARVCMAGQVITIVCNLVMLLYFGGEIQEMRAVHGSGGKFRTDKGGEASPISADMQSLQLGENPHPGDVFQRLYLTGSASMVVPPSAPESKAAQKTSRAAAAALGEDSWQA
ncbi:hypothetical protein ABPG77_000843 [Micractinium sp. CCAP 211/92]